MQLRSIIVLGGGTAGWLAAAYLQRTLGVSPGMRPSITLVESSDIATIGVGEATVPTLRQTIRTLGIPEHELFTKADASLKNGIRFVDWAQTPGNGDGRLPRHYYHPFDVTPPLEGYGTAIHWLNLLQRGLMTDTFGDAGCVQTALCDNNRSPRLMHSAEFEAPVPYAYHIDAGKLASLLKEHAVRNGVRHIVGTVTSVDAGEHGIEAVHTREQGRLEADFFIDCSGFSGLLIERTLEEPWVSLQQYLPCDRAVACQIPHAAGNAPIRSYTTATAKESGWIWEIDLATRRGTGFVYASDFCSPAEAERVLREHVGDAGGTQPVRHLEMRVGHRCNALVKNCLALGLSGGFVEPLESTGIYLIEHALQLFIDYLGTGGITPRQTDRFNAMMRQSYEEIRDFISLHYVISQRRDSDFWRACTNEVPVSPRLAEMLALWEEKVPTWGDMSERISLFGPQNYFYILAGLGRLPTKSPPICAYIAPEVSRRSLNQIAQWRETAVRGSPTMRDYIQRIRGAANIVTA